MQSRLRISLLGMLLIASGAAAQSVELTPFAGYQFGGTFIDHFDDGFTVDDIDVEESESFGLMLDIAITENAQIELLYSLQETELETPRFFGTRTSDLDVEYFHVGFLWQWIPNEKIRPFVVGSLGVASFDLAGVGDETAFSQSVGGGVKVLANKHFGVRFEGRMYSTLVDEGDEVFCNPEICFAYEEATFLLQFDFKVGLVFAF